MERPLPQAQFRPPIVLPVRRARVSRAAIAWAVAALLAALLIAQWSITLRDESQLASTRRELAKVQRQLADARAAAGARAAAADRRAAPGAR